MSECKQPKVLYAENLVRNIHVSTVLVHECAALQGTDIWDVTTYAVCYVIHMYIHVQLLHMLCAY